MEVLKRQLKIKGHPPNKNTSLNNAEIPSLLFLLTAALSATLHICNATEAL
jgi:hypothetical protein